MHLRPSDLGDSYQSAIVLRRARRGKGGADQAANQRVDGWTKRSVRPLNLAAAVEQDTLPAVSSHSRPRTYAAIGAVAGVALATATAQAPVDIHIALALLPVGVAVASRMWMTRATQALYTRPIRESDIAHLRPKPVAPAQAPWIEQHLPDFLREMLPPRPDVKTVATLETDYFDLVASILRLPEPESSVSGELRETVHQIGDAVAAIRKSEIEEDRADARDLIGDAEMLAARARREPDEVVAASFLRQARAKVSQAKVVEGNVTLRRRTRALDAELRAQIAATRSTLRNLSSQGTMSLESNGAFRSIASSVRTLATEATSVNAARDELAAALRGDTQATNASAVQTAGTGVQASPAVLEPDQWNKPVDKPVVLRNRR